MCVPLARRPWFWLLAFAPLLLWSRWPLLPGQLFTFDDVNLAWSIHRFDIRISQPQPPGYPLFVLEMRLLWALRFRHVEHLLFALALAGSLAALLLLAWWGNRFFGGASGFYAACVLALHPVFWHAGVTSALRVQLALISLAVAACCWQAWEGDGRWVRRGAIVLGLTAGIRPETGPLLFPLWAAGAWLAPVSWHERRVALGAMAAAVLVWLLPAMLASGGPVEYVRACLNYIVDQGSVSSGLFGASQGRWQKTFWWLAVWVFCGLPGLALPFVAAWRRADGWGVGWRRAAFLALWFAPSFAFALLVHVEDPGHTLAMAPAVALVGGYWIERSIANLTAQISRWHTAIAVAAACALFWLFERQDAPWLVTWAPPLFLAVGLLLKFAPAKYAGFPPRGQIVLALLFPVAIQNLSLFNHRGWYFRGGDAAIDRVHAEVDSAIALTTREHIETTLALDDHVLREVKRLAAERPGQTVVVWEQGQTAWRKAAYYLPDLRIVLLDRKRLRAGSPAVVDVWRGSRLEQHLQGAAPLRVELPRGGRVVWMLRPGDPLPGLVASGPVWFSDLPAEAGGRALGDYRIEW